MNGRLYDPALGRMLSPDNYAGADGTTQSFNRYSYVLNNPLKYTDPDGENPLITGVIGAAAGAAFYALDYGFSHNFDYSGWNSSNWAGLGMAAVGGAMIGLGIPAAGMAGLSPAAATVLQVGMSQISSHLPSVNIPIGSNASLSISPALVFGSGGFGFGANIGLTVGTEGSSFSLSYGFTQYAGYGPTGEAGSSYGKGFLEQRLGADVTYGSKDFSVGIGSSTFWGGGTGQRTAHVGVAGSGWSFIYENDWLYGDNKWSYPAGDGGKISGFF